MIPIKDNCKGYLFLYFTLNSGHGGERNNVILLFYFADMQARLAWRLSS